MAEDSNLPRRYTALLAK